MKFQDPPSVTTRCNRMMKASADSFAAYLGTYRRYGESCYFGEEDKEDIRISFLSGGKLLSKVFGLYAVLMVDDVQMERDWEIKAKFSGGMKIEGMVFKPTRKEDAVIADRLNYNESLMDELTGIVSSFDIKDIIINYCKTQKKISVKIVPYAGALVWVKIPPIYYDIKLKDFEIEKICLLLELFKKYFSGKW